MARAIRWLRMVDFAATSSTIAAWRDMHREVTLLTENEVQRSFRNMFKSKEVPPDTFDKAEALLEELRAESPLRHRLSIELDEIRKLHTAKA